MSKSDSKPMPDPKKGCDFYPTIKKQNTTHGELRPFGLVYITRSVLKNSDSEDFENENSWDIVKWHGWADFPDWAIAIALGNSFSFFGLTSCHEADIDIGCTNRKNASQK